MVTRPGWLVVVGSVLVVAAGRLFGLPELYLLGATGIALVVVAVVVVRRRAPVLDVERTIHPRQVPLGTSSRVELRITNRGRRRTPVLSMHDPVAGTVGATVSLAPLAPAEKQAASYRLPTEHRGVVRIGPLDAQLTDAFGLARRRFTVAGDAALTVLPAIEDLGGPSTGGGFDDPLAGVVHPVLGSAGDEDFATLRPYVVGDDLRRVHWSSSARADDLLVRQDDPPWQGHVTVLLDARRSHLDAEHFELAVSAAASLLHAVALRGDRARLVITDGTDSGLLDARTGRDTLLEHLAVVDRHPGTDLPQPAVDGRTRSGGLVLVTGTPVAVDVGILRTLRSRFAAIRVVAIAEDPAPVPGVEVVAVPDGVSFASAWRTSSRRPVALR